MEDKLRILEVSIQAAGLMSILFVGITYYLDKRWKRSEAIYKFYNEFDTDKDCQIAMFMIDHGDCDSPFEFDYEFVKLSKAIHVRYDLEKRMSAMGKPYGELSEEEQVIRYIFDVYIGHLERIYYLLKMGYFKKLEIIFFRYWLDKLSSSECDDIRHYAKGNSNGMYIPLIDLYERKLRKSLVSCVR